MAEAQDAAADYFRYKTETVLSEAIADPYYAGMQILDDQEHGWDAPDRLYAFADLLKAEGRTEETDRQILLPWLVRYLWVTDFPNYTQGAWRVLSDLHLEDEFMKVAAMDVLTRHPHGLARAAVIEATENYQPWLEEPAFLALLKRLAFEDPHPDVRRNAIQHLNSARSLTKGEAEAAMKTDPAAEVRAVLAQVLANAFLINKEWDDARTEAALREALFAPENDSVADEILRAYLHSGTIKSDPQRLSQGLNWLAAHRDHPFRSIIETRFDWQMDVEALPLFLSGAPYADGEALGLWLRELFADRGRPLANRSHALNQLARLPKDPLAPQDVADFFFDPGHDAASLAPLFDISIGSDALRRIFATWPASMVSQAPTQVELVGKLLAFLNESGPDGKTRGDSDTQVGMLREAIRLLRIAQDGPEKAALVESLLIHAQQSPMDLIYGVSDLLKNRELVSDERFEAFARGMHENVYFSSLTDIFVDRLRPGPWEDPVIQAGDLTLAIALLEVAGQRNPGEPGDAYREVYDLIHDLPVKADLPPDLPDLAAFEARLREMRAKGENEEGYYAINRWLGDEN
ncbi:MAG: hypothetical protein ACK5MQ_15080 [Pikeienuella sp.]